MAEADRTLARQRVICPTDNSLHVDIPVINSMAWTCAAEQAQEYRWTINNTLDNQIRAVHTHRVTNVADSSQYLDVERIDGVGGKIMANQAQEYLWNLKNFDPPPQPPELIGEDPQHRKVHYVRYYKDNNTSSDAWIDVELIDQCKITCMAEQAQEYIFYLKNPELGDPAPDPDGGLEPPDPYRPTIATCNPDLHLLDGQAPWRFDPFQNVVNVHWRSVTTHTAEWEVWLQPHPSASEFWRISWYEKWGGIDNGPYPYFGEPPFADFDAGAETISWAQWYTSPDGHAPPSGPLVPWETLVPALLPLRIQWQSTGMQVRPEFKIIISPPWEPPPTA